MPYMPRRKIKCDVIKTLFEVANPHYLTALSSLVFLALSRSSSIAIITPTPTPLSRVDYAGRVSA